MTIDKSAKYTMKLETTCGDIDIAHGRGEDPAHRELVRLPGGQGLLRPHQVPPADHARASTCCSAVTRRAPAWAAPATPSRTRT